MSDPIATAPLSLWESLPKAEQQKLIKQMNKVREEAPSVRPQKKNGQFQLKGYVRCELSASDKESFKEWETQKSAAECYELLIKAADSGYLLKVGEQGQGAQASLCAAATGQAWDGYVLVAHAGNAVRAAMLLVYKHELLMQRDWSAWLADEGEEVLR
jgi:hypothetical protein